MLILVVTLVLSFNWLGIRVFFCKGLCLVSLAYSSNPAPSLLVDKVMFLKAVKNFALLTPEEKSSALSSAVRVPRLPLTCHDYRFVVTQSSWYTFMDSKCLHSPRSFIFRSGLRVKNQFDP